MKICLVTERFYPDESEATAVLYSQIVNSLSECYSEVTFHVITGTDKKNHCQKKGGFDKWLKVRIYRLAISNSESYSLAPRLIVGTFFCLLSLFKIFQLYHKEKYDLIMVGTNPPVIPLIGLIAFKILSIPYVYLIHDLYPDIAIELGAITHDSFLARSARVFQYLMLNNAEKIIVVGRCMRKKINLLYNTPLDKIILIPNWGNDLAFQTRFERSSTRNSLNLKGFILVYAGTIGKAQQLNVLIGAANILQNSHPDILFLIAGDGDNKKEISLMIERQKILNIVLLPGVPLTQYFNLLACADVGIVSLQKSLKGLAVPSKTYNILASKRPIIAIADKDSEISLMIREFECGLQVEPGDEKELANAIIKLKTNYQLANYFMGKRAYKAFKTKYTLDCVTHQYYRLFKSLINEP